MDNVDAIDPPRRTAHPCFHILGAITMALTLLGAADPVPAADDTSCEWVCREHPGRVQALFDALELEHRGLEKVKAAVEKKDWPAACRALVAYYREGDTADWLRRDPPKPGTKRDKAADRILNDTFTIQRVTARQPRKKSGRLDWHHCGPNNDREWAWLLNRHSYFYRLLHAWRRTGNPEYARCFDRHVRDWVLSNPPPDHNAHTATWRRLEVGLRLRGSWPRGFYGFQPADAFSPAARILMLSSVPEQAEYVRKHHAGGSNHMVMELYGLANASACWPEFKRADAWFDYAVEKMVPEIERQVYPDGVQKELTSHYHWVSLGNFEPFARLARRLGRPIPREYDRMLEAMWSYLAWSMRPDGYGVLNNDSDRDFTRRRVLRAARDYKRPDWRYIASNGEQGKKPDRLPSIVFPWAGQAVMRSGFGPDAQWAFFDVGPAGMMHQHYDRLHLSVAAFGRDLLVDGGRYWYKGGRWRGHFKGSASHNTILIDGAGQKCGTRVVDKPTRGSYRTAPAFDFVRGSFADGYEGVAGEARHIRAVVYLRGACWVVVDRIETDRPRRIGALWHFHPECTVAADGLSIASTDAKKGNARIVPVGSPDWTLEIVQGRTKPTIQGWYSPEYNVKRASPTAVYRAKVDGAATFAWVIVPAKGPVPDPTVEVLAAPGGAMRLRVKLTSGGAGDKIFEVAVRLAGEKPVPLSRGLRLDGACAILRPGEAPLVAIGTVTDNAGRVLARHLDEK
ncbi:MAG: alginate lyase family protein [Planctomycetota bacterium]